MALSGASAPASAFVFTPSSARGAARAPFAAVQRAVPLGAAAGPEGKGSSGLPSITGAAALLAVLGAARRQRGDRRKAGISRRVAEIDMGRWDPESRTKNYVNPWEQRRSRTSSLFAGVSFHANESPRVSVAMRSLLSCHTLFFKSIWWYKDRARRNLRNRAYNIWMKNKYKKSMKRVLRRAVEIAKGDWQPQSVDEVMSDIKGILDDACFTIDQVCVQGVLHRRTAARRKERMCRKIGWACIRKGLLTPPEDPFMPCYKFIGYDMPRCTLTREPRPWQLPGWKSPWMLKQEYDKWKKLREARMEEEALAMA